MKQYNQNYEQPNENKTNIVKTLKRVTKDTQRIKNLLLIILSGRNQRDRFFVLRRAMGLINDHKDLITRR